MTDDYEPRLLDALPDRPIGRTVVERTGDGVRIRIRPTHVRDTLGCVIPCVLGMMAMTLLSKLFEPELAAAGKRSAMLLRITAAAIAFLVSLQLWAWITRQSKLELTARMMQTGRSGCIVALVLTLLGAFAISIPIDGVDFKWNDPLEISAAIALGGIMLLALLFGLHGMSREVILDVTERTLVLTSRTWGKMEQQEWPASDIRALGVHRSEGRGDETRLEMVLRSGTRQVLHEDVSSLDLAIAARLLREALDVPEDAPMEDAPTTPMPDEHLPRGDASRLLIEEQRDGVHYRLRSAKGENLGCATVLALLAAPCVWFWGYHMPGRWHESGNLGWVLLLLLFFMLSAAVVLGFFLFIYMLAYRERFVLAGQTLTRHRRFLGYNWSRSWQLDDTSSFDLYMEQKSANVRVRLTIGEEQHDLANWSWPASARDWVEDMSRRTGVPVRRFDAAASYDL